MLGSCLAIALLAALYEGLRVGRVLLAAKMERPLVRQVTPAEPGTCQCGTIGDGESKGSTVTSQDTIINIEDSRRTGEK